ncbi:SDA1 family protein [Thraustotheca clavata]|uniref:Protein SDA1 n=1 Tax=Thraustotheca clavata TaxID=74557 RepID=A0A1V9ZHQ2_9STRA|nr:SDA1 family protein [Thraustotheca clavata]
MADTRTDFLVKLPQLQNMVKRDPAAYRDEFLMQFRHYQSELAIFRLQPSKESEHFGALVSFLSHVATCYPSDLAIFPTDLIQLLEKHSNVLEATLRKTLVQSLILMRNRNVVDALVLLKLFFELFRCPDKRLREILYSHIVYDLKRMHNEGGGRNDKVMRGLQSFLYSMVADENEIAAIKSLHVLISLYRKKIWCDARTVNCIASACTSKTTRVMVTAIQFFLGIDTDILEDEEAEKEKTKEQVEVNYHSHSKKTKKRHNHTKAQLVKNRKARNRDTDNQYTFPAIDLLHDPQGIAERQLKILKASNERFEVRLLMMDFIGRLIGQHKLIVLPFYPLLQRYLTAHQQNVTQILAYLVQACHDDIPPEEIMSVVRTIANSFIVERCSSEVIAVGINAVREIFARIPLVMEEEGMDALLQDLIMFNKSRDKTTVIAARGVLNLVRELHPSLLKRKDRGKFHDAAARPKAFGELRAQEGVEGAELLMEAEASGRFDAEDNEDGWDIDEEALDAGEVSEDGWVDIESEESDGLHSDTESEGEEGDEEAENDEEEETSTTAIPQAQRIDAQRILTPKDFERIELLKKEAAEAAKDPKARRKRKAEEVEKKALEANFSKVDPSSLEGYSKKKRQTQEERLRSVLEGRENFAHRKSGGGTTNREKDRLKNFLMLKKSRKVQAKVLKSTREIQHIANKTVKKVLKRDAKKRRRT